VKPLVKSPVSRLALPLVAASLTLAPQVANAAEAPYRLNVIQATVYYGLPAASLSNTSIGHSTNFAVGIHPGDGVLPNGSPANGGTVAPSIVGGTTAFVQSFQPDIPLTNIGHAGAINAACGVYLNYVNERPDAIGTTVIRHANHMANAFAANAYSGVNATLRAYVNAPGEDEWTPSPFAALSIPEASFYTPGADIPGNTTFFADGWLSTAGPNGTSSSGVAISQINGDLVQNVSFDLYVRTNAYSYAYEVGSNAHNNFLTSVSSWASAIVPDPCPGAGCP
jgi:hypothetical protein